MLMASIIYYVMLYTAYLMAKCDMELVYQIFGVHGNASDFSTMCLMLHGIWLLCFSMIPYQAKNHTWPAAVPFGIVG